MRLPLPRFTRRRLLAPEVVQTSAMDCGPAALKCLLEGFGLPVSYGRLREACQTDVDGTSIDVLEDTAVRLGLAAEQIMIPADHLLLPEARALPALLVAVRPGGVTHFIVVWRRIGPLVQVMDPAIGRRWMTERELLDEVYVHRLNVPADDWAAWARSEDFCRPLERRLRRLGGGRTRAAAWVRQAATDPTAERLAALDAAARLVAALIDSGGATRGRAAARLVQTLAEAARDCDGKASVIPEALWTVRPAEAVDDRPQRALRGIVLLRVRGRQPRPVAEGEPSAAAALSRELRAAVAERPVRVAREVFRLLGPGAWRSAAALGGGMFLSAAGLVCEALLLRGAMEAARDLHLVEQRLGAVAMFLLFVLALLLVELQVVRGVLRWGRELEVRLRMAFLRKLPRLNDRYFRSRPASDMAERSHTSHQVRHLPWLGGELLRHALTLLLTTAAIGLLYPDLAAAAWVSAALMVGLPLAFSRRLEEQDLRVRTHTGALSRFDFDALLGLWPVRAHAAELVLRREHEGLLVEWARASLRLVRTTAVVDAAVTGIGFALAGWLVLRHVQSAPEPAGALLLAYWALQLPVLGSEFALLVAQRPFYRNSFLRLMEPLGAPEESPAAVERTVEATRGASRLHSAGMELDGVDVVAAGRTILRDVSLRIEPGTHVAVVGASGAGKSSLVGLLLGWHRPSRGTVLYDGAPLSADRLEDLRRHAVWVDPAVQLWNRPLVVNLHYGRPRAETSDPDAGSVPVTPDGACRPSLADVLRDGELLDVLDRLPDGLQSRLGESGGLLSAGEGQRVRLGRALLHGSPRLVLLDEPFRGLERERRGRLLRRARSTWRGTTLVCVTHDVEETEDFDHVLVMQEGSIVEAGRPAELASRSGSRYRSLLEAARISRSAFSEGRTWRRLTLQDGRLSADTHERSVPDAPGAESPGVAPVTRVASVPDSRASTADAGSFGDEADLCWPEHRLGEALAALARDSGLATDVAASVPHAPSVPDTACLNDWLTTAAGAFDLEAEPLSASWSDLNECLLRAGPAIVQIGTPSAPRFLLVAGRRGHRLLVLSPDGARRTIASADVRSAVARTEEARVAPTVESILAAGQVPSRRRVRAREALLGRLLGTQPIDVGWLLRTAPAASLGRQAREFGLRGDLGRMLVGHAGAYGLWVASWWVLGTAVLRGRVDAGWLTAWGLLLATLLPLHVLATWAGGRLAVRAGAVIKRRLLAGALRLDPDQVRALGSGRLLGRVHESQVLDGMALTGGFLAAAALIELIFAALVLRAGEGGGVQVLALGAWSFVAAWLAWRQLGHRRRWTDHRFALTDDLVEKLIGHRTRLVQEPPADWHAGEDESLAHYHELSRRLDRSVEWFKALVPRGWLAVGMLALAPAFVPGRPDAALLAVSIGGVLLAYHAFHVLSHAVERVTAAVVAWDRVRPLWDAARQATVPSPAVPSMEAGGLTMVDTLTTAHTSPRSSILDPPSSAPASSQKSSDVALPASDTAPLLTARNLAYRYPGRGRPVLHGASIDLCADEWVLLTGSSGGGKSTLAALLAGLREPQSGVVLFGGLDRATLGERAWRRRVLLVPQFHQNHLVLGSLAFNLLLGRGWPPRPADLAEAQRICRSLGLGRVLDEMPGGLHQIVGETGWQLSHGERNRVFLARALLQRPDVLILDESVEALDPETLAAALACLRAEAPTLLLIAHP